MIRFSLLLVCLHASLLLAGTVDSLQQYVIPLGAHADMAKTSTDELQKVLRSVGPSKKGQMEASVLEKEEYVLHGDLFKNGRSYALIVLQDQTGYTRSPGVAFLVWNDGR